MKDKFIYHEVNSDYTQEKFIEYLNKGYKIISALPGGGYQSGRAIYVLELVNPEKPCKCKCNPPSKP